MRSDGSFAAWSFSHSNNKLKAAALVAVASHKFSAVNSVSSGQLHVTAKISLRPEDEQWNLCCTESGALGDITSMWIASCNQWRFCFFKGNLHFKNAKKQCTFLNNCMLVVIQTILFFVFVHKAQCTSLPLFCSKCLIWFYYL